MRLDRRLCLIVSAALLASGAAHATPGEAAAATPEAVAPVAPTPSGSEALVTPADDTEASAPFGFRVNPGPLTINSDELDADDRNGGRKIVFRKHVEVRQGDLKVTCERLEALYPAGSKQPTRLVATGNVQLSQGDQQVWCDEAVFDRVAEKLFCRGNGRFVDRENELRGREIEIDLKRESVRVRGDARVVIRDDSPTSPASPASPAVAP